MSRHTPSPPPWHWTDARTAQHDLADRYLPGLHAHARSVAQRLGRTACDQDFPVERLHCVPPGAHRPPLLIVGGMGPLAGAQALQAALQRFGDRRETVLLQLCSVPDRSRALAGDAGQSSALHRGVVEALHQGIAAAEATLHTRHLGPAHVVVACNTAHHFVPEAFARLRHTAPSAWQLHSMVDRVVRWLAGSAGPAGWPVLVLGTDGTRRTRLYSDPLEASGVACVVPDPLAQRRLTAAIYQGVEAFDTDAVLHHGQALLRRLVATGALVPGQPLVALCACTEVPEILSTLRDRGGAEVRDLLAGVRLADPMAITLDHIGRLDAGA